MFVEFRGTKYYKIARYGYFVAGSGGGHLQRAVWREEHGNIPHGWHVHHKPGALKSTTDVNDLQCMAPLDHFREHRAQRMAQTCLRPLVKRAFVCVECGNSYEAVFSGRNKYCSHRCNLRAWKRRKAALA